MIVQAALVDEVPLDPERLPAERRLFKFGVNPTFKGDFILDEAGAASVMKSFREHGIDLYYDYEHDRREAAAWFVPEVRADGLWATNIRWTPRATDKLRGKEYRYDSPMFHVDEKKRITRLVNVGLTNLPATHNQDPLVAAREAIELAEWSTAFIDSLPDSSFLYIEPGGKKDGEGKTTPRALRHFPVKDASGKIDLPHLRNALARIPQSSVPSAVKERAATEAKRLLGNQRVATKEANDRLAARLAASFRLVTGMPARKRSAL